MHHPGGMLKLNDIITIIHAMNLRSLDLNLLVVFDALMRKRNVTHAAQSIGLSQPAFSNALTRLRERLGDELFVRGPNGMRPTPWALELNGPVSMALTEIENALEGAFFDPATSNRSFTIATEDYGMMVFVPPLLERVGREAPDVVINIITASRHYGEYLETQQADVALISWPDPADRFVSEPLLDEDWVCVMRAGHQLASGPMNLTEYTGAQHLLVSTRRDAHGEVRGWVDHALAEQGLGRHVALTMGTFAPTPLVLEITDLIMACPRRVGETFANRFGLALTDCPVSPPPTYRSVDMVWHKRLGNHPAQIWLRELLRDIAISTET